MSLQNTILDLLTFMHFTCDNPSIDADNIKQTPTADTDGLRNIPHIK